MLLTRQYDRVRAVTYAETWALARNPLFINFTGQGGDLHRRHCLQDAVP